MVIRFLLSYKYGWEVFVIAIIISVIIAWITVGYKAIKAAIANPVKSLRTE
jgi:ABC-type antimicrobial peptide transport system permease subunit